MAGEVAQEAYPNLIAKYLLDGWCMLNESCTKHLTPLLRSRDGRELCVACEATSRRQLESAGPPPAPKPFLAEPSSARVNAQEIDTGRARPSALRATPADGLWEVLVQGPDLKFCCTRLASRDKRRLRLLAESIAVKVRLAAAVGVDASLLREAAAEICGKLADKVILPKFASGNTQISEPVKGQICVTSEGASFSLPEARAFVSRPRFVVRLFSGIHKLTLARAVRAVEEEDCLQVPSARVTPESIAAIIWEHLEACAVPALQQVPALSEVSGSSFGPLHFFLVLASKGKGVLGQPHKASSQLTGARERFFRDRRSPGFLSSLVAGDLLDRRWWSGAGDDHSPSAEENKVIRAQSGRAKSKPA